MVVMGERSHVLKDAFQGNCYHQSSSLKLCDLSTENTECLMALFPYTKPISLRKYPMTIGTGDRLGRSHSGTYPGHQKISGSSSPGPAIRQRECSNREKFYSGDSGCCLGGLSGELPGRLWSRCGPPEIPSGGQRVLWMPESP